MGLACWAANLLVLESAAARGEGQATAAAQLTNVLGVALGTGVAGTAVAMSTAHGQPLRSGIAIVSAIAAAALGVLAAWRLQPSAP